MALSFRGLSCISQCINGISKSGYVNLFRPFSVSSHRPSHHVTCTLVPGDGVGPEICHAVKEVFQACGIPVKFEELFISEYHPKLSVPLETVCKSILKNKIALKGPHDTPQHSQLGELQSLNMKIREELDLYANVVHIRKLPGVKTRHKKMDFYIIREQTEGEYSALEHESVPGVIECLKIVTREKSTRIAKFAFEYAVKHKRKKVTAVHKANIMKQSDGLFLRCCGEQAEKYPQIKFDNMIIDNTCMQLVSHPEQFDVMVMPNLYGSIIDNLSTGLVGGAGVVPGCSYGVECCVYEPGAKHSFSQAQGKNIANPTAMFLCACKMLSHIDQLKLSKLFIKAIRKVILDGKVVTRDIGGQSSTSDFTIAVINELNELMKTSK